jgi:hypothetical protein
MWPWRKQCKQWRNSRSLHWYAVYVVACCCCCFYVIIKLVCLLFLSFSVEYLQVHLFISRKLIVMYLFIYLFICLFVNCSYFLSHIVFIRVCMYFSYLCIFDFRRLIKQSFSIEKKPLIPRQVF